MYVRLKQNHKTNQIQIKGTDLIWYVIDGTYGYGTTYFEYNENFPTLLFLKYCEYFSEQSTKVICLELFAVCYLNEGIIISSWCQEHMENLLKR